VGGGSSIAGRSATATGTGSVRRSGSRSHQSCKMCVTPASTDMVMRHGILQLHLTPDWCAGAQGVQVCAGCRAPVRLQGIAVQRSDDARSLSARVFSALDLELAAPDHMRPTGGTGVLSCVMFHSHCSCHSGTSGWHPPPPGGSFDTTADACCLASSCWNVPPARCAT
jgi:hypothetical protein